MAQKDKRNLNDRERRLIFDLYNLGMDQEYIAKFYDVAPSTVYKTYLFFRKTEGEPGYSLAETARIMTQYTLASLVRTMPAMTTEQKLKFLPDLLKVKEESHDDSGEDMGTVYIPKKEHKQEPKPNIKTEHHPQSSQEGESQTLPEPEQLEKEEHPI